MWRVLNWLFAAGLTAVFLWMVDLGQLPGIIRGIDSGAFGLSFALTFIGGIWIPAMVTRLASSINQSNFTFWEILRINLSVRFYTVLLPLGLATAVRFMKFAKMRGGVYSSLAVILLERALQVLALAVCVVAGLCWDLSLLGQKAWTVLLPAALLLILSLMVLQLFLNPAFSLPLKRMLEGQASGKQGPWREKAHRFASAIGDFSSITRRQLCTLIGGVVAGQILLILSQYMLTQALKIEIPFSGLLWIRSVAILFMMVPISAAGFGLRALSFVGLMPWYGCTEEQGLAMALTVWAIQVLIALLGGAVELWEWIMGSKNPAGESAT